ncbi:MAG: type II secretion system protein [Undibacterium sp.]|nr:type II secretion system protein [Undibacterium sp.]
MHHPKPSEGLAYLSLLIVVALLAITAAATLQLGVAIQKREAEEELLWIGQQFRDALVSYANATPPGANRHPASLQDLLKDSRSVIVRRHLRKIFVDPMTRQADWGLVFGVGQSGIVGVHSLSDEVPIKRANFPEALHNLENQEKYRSWTFSVE